MTAPRLSWTASACSAIGRLPGPHRSIGNKQHREQIVTPDETDDPAANSGLNAAASPAVCRDHLRGARRLGGPDQTDGDAVAGDEGARSVPRSRPSNRGAARRGISRCKFAVITVPNSAVPTVLPTLRKNWMMPVATPKSRYGTAALHDDGVRVHRGADAEADEAHPEQEACVG